MSKTQSAKKPEADLQRISRNFDAFRKLCESLGDRSQSVLAMVDELSTRLAMAPASAKEQYHAAWPGGLVEHSLNVCKLALKLNELYSSNIPRESVILASLFHDLGKVGDLKNDYYEDQDSDWHRERGNFYKISETIQRMPASHRGLYLLQAFGIKLTQDEWIAIATNEGLSFEGNGYYSMHEPQLALIVQHADRMACEREKTATQVKGV